MFYNKEVKKNFIADYLRSRVVSETAVRSLLHKVAITEEKLGKDCCCFTQDEILNMYTSFDAKSVHVLSNYNVYLKGYAGYCMHHRLCTENSYNGITKEMLEQCINPDTIRQTILTREQLDDIEDMLYNYTDKAVLECLYEGIAGKGMADLVSLDRASISQDKTTLYLKSGRSVPLTQRLHYYLESAFEENQYFCYGNRIIVQDLIGEGCLYKEMKNAYAVDSEDKFFRWVYRKIMTFRKFVDIPGLTMKNIQASGLLHKIKRGMEDSDMGFKEYLKSDKGKMLAYQYGYSQKHYVTVIVDKYEWYFK